MHGEGWAYFCQWQAGKAGSLQMTSKRLRTGNLAHLVPEGVPTILAAVFAMALNDAIIKYASSGLTLWQIWVLRSLFMLPALLLLTRGRLHIKGGIWVALRTLCLIGMYLCVYPAFPLLNLAVAGAAFYTAPFFIVGLSALILGNVITWRHWVAITVGFSGLLLVVRPFGAAFTPAILLPVAGALCYSLAAIVTRAKCHTVDVRLQALWLNIGFLVLGVMGSLSVHVFGVSNVSASDTFLLGQWQPMQAKEWATIAILAALMLAMAVGVAKAYQSPHPEIIATVEYSYIIFAVFWGYVFFSEIPDGWSLAGMVLITAGGLMTVSAGRRRFKPVT